MFITIVINNSEHGLLISSLSRAFAESFDLLGLDHRGAYQRGPVKQWDDNCIGYSTDCVWRYDEFGRRIEQLQSLAPNAQGQPQRSRQELRYDGDHQLPEVHCTYSNGRPEQHLRYTYDALGRRLLAV